jgi:outer membrane protein, heavy metal efflux system
MSRILTLALLICAGMVLSAQAEGAASVANQTSQVLGELEAKLRQHPAIASYASRAEASAKSADGELGLPDPLLFAEQLQYSFNSDATNRFGDRMVGFRQEIPRTALREARSGKLQAESRKNRLLQDYAFASLKAKMIAAFADLEKVKALHALALEQDRLLQIQRRSAQGSVAANRAGPGAVSLADAERQDISIRLAELEEERHQIKAMLVNLLGEAPDIALPMPEMTAWDSDPSLTYPVAIAASDIEMARKDVDIREEEFGPSFEVQARAGRLGNGGQGGSIMLGVSIPLWASENQKPRLQGAKAALSAAEYDRDSAQRQVMETLSHLQAQIDASIQKTKLLERKLSLLQVTADAETREYGAGRGDFASILSTRREALAVQAQAATERATQAALVADFNRYIIEGGQP